MAKHPKPDEGVVGYENTDGTIDVEKSNFLRSLGVPSDWDEGNSMASLGGMFGDDDD